MLSLQTIVHRLSEKSAIAIRSNTLDQNLTYCSNNLCFQAELIGEATNKVLDSAFAIWSDVRYVSNVVEHMSTCEE